MSLEDETADWGRQEDERETASRFRSYQSNARKQRMDEVEDEGDGDGFIPIRLEGAKRISKLLWRVTDKFVSKISKKMKLTPAEMAELVDDTAPVVQLYVPDPGTLGGSPWWALGLTVIGVYSSKVLFGDGNEEKEKPPAPANETVDGKVVSPAPGANSPKEPPRATA